MKPAWLPAAVGAAAVLVVGTLVYQHVANRSPNPALRDSVAVLTAAKRPDSIAHATAVAESETAAVASRGSEQHAQVHQQRADSIVVRIVQDTTARDSAAHWRAAYLEERQRADSLDAALAAQKRATLLAMRADSLSQDRLARVERLNASLVAETERLAGGCHLLPFVRCPTRKETAIGAAVLTFVALHQTHARP